MKKINIFILAMATLSGCMAQTDLMEEWLGDVSYSDKPSNLQVAIGYERVELKWTNPSGPITKGILIEYGTYGEEIQTLHIDEVVDHAEIDGLTSTYGYDFSVYTLDAMGVKSLPITITCNPFTAAYTDQLEEDMAVGSYRTEGGYALRWSFPDGMKYNGKLTYTLTDDSGLNISGTQESGTEETSDDIITAFVTNIIPELREGNTYTLHTTVSALPVSGEYISLDEVALEKEVSFEVVIPQYQISFNTGSGANSIDGQLVYPDGTVTRPENPVHPNKTFVGWRTALQNQFGEYFDFENTKINSSLTLYAVWIPNQLSADMMPVMQDVSGGEFTMGDSWTGQEGELPLHTVTVSSFRMQQTEMTQHLFSYVMNDYNPASLAEDGSIFIGDNLPVNNCNWFEAVVFCNVLSMISGLEPCYSIDGETDPVKWGNVPSTADGWNTIKCDITKKGYRLPTEAEWEFACGGGAQSARDKYAGTNHDDELYKYAWCASEAEGTPHEVGQKRENILNIYDLSGNVMEWCSDSFVPYTADSQNNPLIQDESVSKRVTRGGSWKWDNDSFCRTSWRDGNGCSYRSADVGFRIVQTL